MHRTERSAGVHPREHAEAVADRGDEPARVTLRRAGHGEDGDRAEHEGAEEFGGEAFEVIHAREFQV